METTEFLLNLEKESYFSHDIAEICSERSDYVDYLERKLGLEVYVRLLRTLAHKEFDPAIAKQLWHKIIQHKRQLNHALNRNVGITVATLDYLTNIADEIDVAKVFPEEDVNQLVDVATRDELTGLYTRAVAEVSLKKNYEEAQRYHRPLSVMLLDIDDFKEINDQHGHPVGDVVLQRIGQLLNEEVREADLSARYGGEEFLVIMPQTERNTAMTMARRLAKKIAALSFDALSVTASIGVAEALQDATNAQHLLKIADQALYQAKNSGKNKAVYWRQP